MWFSLLRILFLIPQCLRGAPDADSAQMLRKRDHGNDLNMRSRKDERPTLIRQRGPLARSSVLMEVDPHAEIVRRGYDAADDHVFRVGRPAAKRRSMPGGRDRHSEAATRRLTTLNMRRVNADAELQAERYTMRRSSAIVAGHFNASDSSWKSAPKWRRWSRAKTNASRRAERHSSGHAQSKGSEEAPARLDTLTEFQHGLNSGHNQSWLNVHSRLYSSAIQARSFLSAWKGPPRILTLVVISVCCFAFGFLIIARSGMSFNYLLESLVMEGASSESHEGRRRASAMEEKSAESSVPLGRFARLRSSMEAKAPMEERKSSKGKGFHTARRESGGHPSTRRDSYLSVRQSPQNSRSPSGFRCSAKRDRVPPPELSFGDRSPSPPAIDFKDSKDASPRRARKPATDSLDISPRRSKRLSTVG
jgi:hypothetical protein